MKFETIDFDSFLYNKKFDKKQYFSIIIAVNMDLLQDSYLLSMPVVNDWLALVSW